MEFYEAVRNRRTVREWNGTDVSKETILRIIQAGLMAPTNDHQRKWEFILLHTQEEKEKALKFVKDEKDFLDNFRDESEMKTLAQKMFYYAVPRQHRMLSEAAWVILPLFRETTTFNATSFSGLNSFSSAWCAIENIFLASAAEGLGCAMRIPVGEESRLVCKEMNVPHGWAMPCYIGIGHPAENALKLEQHLFTPEQKVHYGNW